MERMNQSVLTLWHSQWQRFVSDILDVDMLRLKNRRRPNNTRIMIIIYASFHKIEVEQG